jgi:hypothetical protein
VAVATMARAAALETVRLAFLRLGGFLAEYDLSDVDHEYADRLMEVWDERFMSLGRYSTDTSISEETREALRFLTDAISVRPENGEEFLQWLAVFPETAANLFPPSETTFRVSREAPEESSPPTHRQAALALAA